MGQIWFLLLILIIKKDILVLGIGPTQGLEHTLTAEKMYSINFTEKRFCLSLHYNGANSYLFVNGKGIIKFKAKDSPLCLGNISKDWAADNMKKTGLNWYVFEFNVDYRDMGKENITNAMLNIHGYLMAKYGII